MDNLPQYIQDIRQQGTWKPYYNLKACSSWLKSVEKCFYKRGNEIFLYTPARIELEESVTQALVREYRPQEEIGGVILCKLSHTDQYVELIGKKFILITNSIEEYSPIKKKASSYYPNVDEYLNILSRNFSRSSKSSIMFPIFVHSHPSITKEYLPDHVDWGKLRLSDGDIGFAKLHKIQLNTIYLRFMNMLLTGGNSEHRVLLFGKGVTPFDFENEKRVGALRGIDEFSNGMKNEFARALIKFALVMAHEYDERKTPPNSKEKGQLKKLFNDHQEKHLYFSPIKKKGNTVIILPGYKKDD